MTLTDFLLARIAEDEDVLMRRSPGNESRATGTVVYRLAHWDAHRLEMECAAKRRIVESCAQPASYIFDDDPDDPIEWSAEVHMAANTLRALASVYADHPDFQQEWRS